MSKANQKPTNSSPEAKSSLGEAKMHLVELRDLSRAGMFTQQRFVHCLENVLADIKAAEKGLKEAA